MSTGLLKALRMIAEKVAPARMGPIPGGLNIGLLVAAGSCALVLLWAASRADDGAILIACAIAFSFVANTVFSLLHEAVHGIFHRTRWLNDAAGIVAAAFFPTGFSLQRALHLGHHRRNRTEQETFDYYYPDDVRALKIVQWYGIISGVYWFVVQLGWLLYLFAPFVFRLSWIARSRRKLVIRTSGSAYARDFIAAPAIRARLELLLSAALQVLWFTSLDGTVSGWLCCYTAFAINWSALQYADHAFAPLQVRDGAWDLRVNPLVRALFLNYHHHRAHHLHPQVPWCYLPDHVDTDRPRPAFLRHYLSMWRGPRPAPGPPASPLSRGDL